MSYFPQVPPSRGCYVLLDGQQRPTAVAGIVVVTDTGGRENPPPPICGLNIDNTPLGRGHVMALQLGGPDVAENIVPQYQQWQQTGAWRQMEVRAAQYANQIFVALLEYANTGDATANGLYDTFPDDDPLVFWDDFRIPTRFRVWLLASGTNPGANIAATVLQAGLPDPPRRAAAGNLAATLGAAPVFAEFTVTAMPQEDRQFWMQNQVAMAVDVSFDEYRNTYEAQSVPSSPYRETEVEYIMDRGGEVRQRLETEHGWLPHELNMYASNSQLLQAVFHEKPLKARTLKSIKLREEKYRNLTLSGGVQKPNQLKQMKRLGRGLR